ncbi:hypothetical protein RIF29_19003 [Crotalaria pallida]|uniref:Uncharacterized protein n=1 Tax=Crotalaria pallida TaxID=3830 RepID=A0AAN9F0H5_CROPI
MQISNTVSPVAVEAYLRGSKTFRAGNREQKHGSSKSWISSRSVYYTTDPESEEGRGMAGSQNFPFHFRSWSCRLTVTEMARKSSIPSFIH